MNKSKKIYSINDLLSRVKVKKKTFYKVLKDKEIYYEEFLKNKKDGTKRRIDNPVGDLKKIQKKLLRFLESVFSFPEYYCGGIKGKSNVYNADIHKGSSVILNLDIRKCFPSTNKALVAKALKNHLKFGDQLSKQIAEITTRNNYLPQGAPTSTFLLNLVTVNITYQLNEYLKSKGFRFTIFIDDITVSGVITKRQTDALIKFINGKVGEKGFALKNSKVNYLKGPFREVTGIHTNDQKITLPSTLRDKIKRLKFLDEKGLITESEQRQLYGYLNYAKTIDTFAMKNSLN